MRIPVLAIVLTMAACGGPDPADMEKADNEVREDDEQETVFDPLVGTVDKARTVEDQVMEQKRQIDEALAEADSDGGGGRDGSE